jgi:hydroxyethylthiazole kinase-like uncharacterized protein yjeF
MKLLSKNIIKTILKPRDPSSHKGNFGHALLIAGSTGKMGAAIIAAKACMRAGVGVLTVSVPQDEALVLPMALPEAMTCIREKDCDNFKLFSAASIGCGIGTSKESLQTLTYLMEEFQKPLLLDADALNIIAVNNSLINKIPAETIITPHPKEFDRLFGAHNNVEERKLTAIEKSKELNITIVLKDHKTLVIFNGKCFENITGNAGLAKAGSGDALTGTITAFLAQGYPPFEAAKLGVYLHGLAADICLEKQSMESMIITDVIDCFGKAFKKLLV